MNYDLKQNGFVLNYNCDIAEIPYREYLDDFGSDETTSPRGVEPRLHIREVEGAIYQNEETKDFINEDEYNDLEEDEQGDYNYYGETTVSYELWSWGVNGNHPHKIESYDTEEEAETALYEHFEWYISEKNWNAPTFFLTREELIENLAEAKEKSYEVIERYFRIKNAAKEKKELKKIAAQKAAEERKQRVKEIATVYAKLIEKKAPETFKETCTRLSQAIGEKIEKDVFFAAVKLVRDKETPAN